MSTTTGVQASFPNDAALQDAIGRLTLLGFDRADLTLPHAAPAVATPEQGASVPTTETDTRQARTLATSLAGATGALAATGITIATGGAALIAVGAAAAVGAGAAGLANLGGDAVERFQTSEREDAARQGELVLTVNARTPEQVARAQAALHDAGATLVSVRATDGSASSGMN
jgi:hypothetical protein